MFDGADVNRLPVNAASVSAEWSECVFVCGFRALPVMFAVTLDLRIFANNVRNLCEMNSRDWSVVWAGVELSVCLCVCVFRRSSSCRRRVKVSRARCWRKQQSSWWAASECVPATSQYTHTVHIYTQYIRTEYKITINSWNRIQNRFFKNIRNISSCFLHSSFISAVVPGSRTLRSGAWCFWATSSSRSTSRSELTTFILKQRGLESGVVILWEKTHKVMRIKLCSVRRNEKIIILIIIKINYQNLSLFSP